METAPVFQPRLSDAGPRSPQTMQVGVLNGLSFKQAFATLVIALAVGLITSAYELLNDYRAVHDQVGRDTAADLSLVRGLAVEAAYQLSSELAGEVVAGLHQNPLVLDVSLSDNYGGLLGQAERSPVPTLSASLAERLFGDVAAHQRPLETRNLNGTGTMVGVLELHLDTGGLFNVWLDRAILAMWSGAARAALLCVLVVAVFYILITKPLLRITASIGRVDPAHPGAFPIPLPAGHRRDELGLLVGAVNTLLEQSQHGLDGRDGAQRELAALARDLERRVAERTHELAREKEGVERALAQLNMANGELEKANRDIHDGIRYASRIQTALLPDQGVLGHIVDDLAVGWQPLDMVGGDYYWAGAFDSKGVIAVMDCTGHGVPGAFMTAVVASSFSRILHHHGHDDPAEMLTQLNRLVKTALRQDRDSAVSNDGLDAAVCVIDRQGGALTFAGANLPLLVAEAGQVRQVRGDRMSLGYLDSPEDFRFTSHRIAVAPGTAFYLYTDGVTDQVGGDNGRLFGRRRLQDVLAEVIERPMDEQMDTLFRRLGQWRGNQRRRDDMTFLAFRPIDCAPEKPRL